MTETAKSAEKAKSRKETARLAITQVKSGICTPKDQKAVKVAAETFRPNPKFSAGQAIVELGVGEALLSFLDTKGVPIPVSYFQNLKKQQAAAASTQAAAANNTAANNTAAENAKG